MCHVHRHVRHCRKRGRLAKADAARSCYATERVFVVPSGCWRALVDVLDEVERLRGTL